LRHVDRTFPDFVPFRRLNQQADEQIAVPGTTDTAPAMITAGGTIDIVADGP